MSKDLKVAFLFPGQGAQYVGMAKDFFESFSVAKETFEEADDLLGRKLSSIILKGPQDVLTQTKNSQVAIFVASVAILRSVQKNFPEITPAICAGLSLGEYTALFASNRLSFEESLKLVQLRGQFMNDACEENSGTMAVVLGMTAEDAEALVKEINLPNDLWAANFNCPGQVVLSGTLKGIEFASVKFKERGAKRVLPLQVHGAFHSGLMLAAEERLSEHVLAANLKESSIDFVMNVPGAKVSSEAEIKKNLIKQVTHPVRWEQGICHIESSGGVDLYLEIGCGKTLTGFNKRIGTKSSTVSIENVVELKNLESAAITAK